MSSRSFVETLPIAYRTAVVAADVVPVPGTVTCTAQAGGSCTANTYNIKVVAGNSYGRTTPKAGNVAVTTATTNLTVRALFAAVTGATYYDIYCSTDADPKFVGRITEAQRASGILITAVNTTGAGGTAGGVDVQVPGTGLQSGTTQAENTAYVMPAATAVNVSGYEKVEFNIMASITGDSVALSCTVIPMTFDSVAGLYQMAAAPTALTFGGTTGALQPLTQRLEVNVRANTAVHLIVAKMAGTGASLNINACSS